MAKLPNDYFPHDFNARHDRKILRLRKVLGLEGYGIFWMLVETLCTEENFSYPLNEIDLLADDYGCSVEKVAAVVKQFDLFKIDKAGNFFSLALITRLQKYLDISEKARLSVNKRWEKARKLKEMDTLVLQPYNEGNTIKEEDIKEQEIKEKEMRGEGEETPAPTPIFFVENKSADNLLKAIASLDNIKKLEKQLTYNEAINLVTNYKSEEITTVIRAMENCKGIEDKNISVYLTAKKWIERDRKTK